MSTDCEHEDTYVDEDNYGNSYLICEDCGAEVEPEDTRDFEQMAEDRAERHRPAGADHRFGTW